VRNGLLEEKKKKEMIRVGTINVITLSGKVNEVVDVMTERGIDILGLSEVKWKDVGKIELNGGYRLWWSGNKEARRNGVGIIVSPKWKEEVLEVQEEGDRIIKIRMKVKHEEWDICQIYAPQVGCDWKLKKSLRKSWKG
jgi:exonuclease III